MGSQDDKLITLEILDRLKTQQADITKIREHVAQFVEKTRSIENRLDEHESQLKPLVKAHHFAQVASKILAILGTVAALSLAFSKLAHAGPQFPPRIGIRLSEVPQVVRLWPHGCSGFVVAKNRIMTAAHCIDGSKPGDVVYPDGKKVTYKPLLWGIPATSTDIAIVAAPTFGIRPLIVATDEQYPEPGMFFSAREGYPVGFPAMLDHMDRADGLGHGHGQVFPGDSGSAVLNARGELAGVVILRAMDNTPNFWFVPLRQVQDILLKLVQSPNK